MFGALDAAGSGMAVNQVWLDAISDNIANVNTVRPTSGAAYQTRSIVAQALPGTGDVHGPGGGEAAVGTGVAVQSIALSSPAGELQYDPTNPIADATGMVRASGVDLGAQMTDLIMAQRGYQADVSSVKAAQQAYQTALGLKL